MNRLFPRGELRPYLIAAGLAVGYYLGARVGFLFQSLVVPQSIMWLPNSILLGVLLITAPREWPLYVLAVLPAQLRIAVEVEAVLPVSLLYFSNCGDALLGAWLVRRFTHGSWRVDRSQHMLFFLLLGATLSPFLMSFVDAGITVATGWAHDYWLAWLTRVRANVLTNIVLVPALAGSWETLRR